METRESSRNLHRAILMLETSRVNAGSNVLNYEQGVQKTDWELYITQLASETTKKAKSTAAHSGEGEIV